MNKLLILPIILAFFSTLLFLPFWIKKTKQIGLLWNDMNKSGSEKVAGSGGIAVVLGFIFGVLLYIAIQTFYFNTSSNQVEIFALTTSVLLLAGIGIIDDLLGWQHGGLSKRIRILLVLIAAIPLIVINAGNSQIFITFFGAVDIGILYPLILIPIGIVGASTTFNFLAGYNGLEAGQGILLLSSLALLSYITGTTWLSLISICMVASLFAFLIFNKYPSSVFPGDVLTYPVGGLIAIMAIMGNYELFALFIFIPYILETGLKLRGRLKKQSFGLPMKDGSIKNKYDKFYGLEHVAIYVLEKIKKSKKAYEWEVVILIHLFQIITILSGFFIIRL
ncbi:MAG: glycosyl transferase family 4 [Candidatus Pacearchaeota archaeon]